MQNDFELLKMLFDFLRGGGLVSVVAAAILLKKYVINGNISKYFEMKEKEVAALSDLGNKLTKVIENQEQFTEVMSLKGCVPGSRSTDRPSLFRRVLKK